VYGLGNYILMDDANIPNIYRSLICVDMFILSHDVPTFHRGKNRFTGEVEEYGSPHTDTIPTDIGPMAIAM